VTLFSPHVGPIGAWGKHTAATEPLSLSVCLLSGLKRTSPMCSRMSANDPKRTFAALTASTPTPCSRFWPGVDYCHCPNAKVIKLRYAGAKNGGPVLGKSLGLVETALGPCVKNWVATYPCLAHNTLCTDIRMRLCVSYRMCLTCPTRSILPAPLYIGPQGGPKRANSTSSRIRQESGNSHRTDLSDTPQSPSSSRIILSMEA